MAQDEQIKFEEPDGGNQRFLLELEFVQALANPAYIHYLAQNRFFHDPAFVRYLSYLQYWKHPPYVRFIRFPHCLFFLDLLQSASFREAMAHHEHKELAHRQQYFFWFHFRNNRLKQLQAQRQQAQAEDGSADAAEADPPGQGNGHAAQSSAGTPAITGKKRQLPDA